MNKNMFKILVFAFPVIIIALVIYLLVSGDGNTPDRNKPVKNNSSQSTANNKNETSDYSDFDSKDYSDFTIEDFNELKKSEKKALPEISHIINVKEVDSKVRIEAAKEVARLRYTPAVKHLIGMTQSEIPEERVAAVHALGFFPGEKGVFDAIVTTKPTDQAPLIPLALMSLRQLGNKKAIPFLINFIRDDAVSFDGARHAFMTLKTLPMNIKIEYNFDIMRDRANAASMLESWWEANKDDIVMETNSNKNEQR